MLVKILRVFAFAGVVFCASVKDYTIEENPSPFYELPCTSSGGICLYKSECPEGKLTETEGLCPLQQDQGVECCYSVARSAKTCRAKTGECMPSYHKCPEYLTVEATDCKKDETCCILVQ